MSEELLPHHAAWLGAHSHRTERWLRQVLRDGFDVHHIDGNALNNEPLNLVLIEHTDHMGLHGGRMLGRLTPSELSRRKERPSAWETRRAKAIGYCESRGIPVPQYLLDQAG